MQAIEFMHNQKPNITKRMDTMCGYAGNHEVHDHWDFRTPTPSPTGKYIYLGPFHWEHYDPNIHGPITQWTKVGARVPGISESRAGVPTHKHPRYYGERLSSIGPVEYEYVPGNHRPND